MKLAQLFQHRFRIGGRFVQGKRNAYRPQRVFAADRPHPRVGAADRLTCPPLPVQALIHHGRGDIVLFRRVDAFQALLGKCSEAVGPVHHHPVVGHRAQQPFE